jgi:hypothetical protein
MRLLLSLVVIAALAMVVRSRRGVEMWHVVADQADGRDADGRDEGP